MAERYAAVFQPEHLSKLINILTKERNSKKVFEFLNNNSEEIKGIISEKDKTGQCCLHYAVRHQRLEVIQSLVEDFNADVNCTNKTMQTPLHLATQKDAHADDVEYKGEPTDHPVLKCLLTAGADPDAKDAFTSAPLHLATGTKETKALAELLRAGANIEVRDSDLRTPLLIAAKEGKTEHFLLLLQHNANLRCTDKMGNTAIEEADSRTPLLKVTKDEQRQQLYMKRKTIVHAQDSRGNNVFHYLVRKQNVAFIEKVIDYLKTTMPMEEIKRLLSAKNKRGETPFHCASGANGLFPLFLKYGVNADVKTKFDDTLMHYVATTFNKDNFALLFSEGHDIEATNQRGDTPLFAAVRKKDERSVEYLLKNKCNPNHSNGEGITPLLLAVRLEAENLVKLLIKYDARLVVYDADLLSPLMTAVKKSNIEIVQAMVEHPDFNILLFDRDTANNTALHLAVKNNNMEIAKILIDNDLSVDLTNSDEETVLHILANNYDDVEMAKFLMEDNDALADYLDSDKNLPLHLAAKNGFIGLLQFFLTKSVAVNAQNAHGQTPLQAAVVGNQLQCVGYLLENPLVMVDRMDKQKCTALFLACENGYTEIADALLAAGANPTLKVSLQHSDYPGWNALDVAVHFKHLGCSKVIIDSRYWQVAVNNETLRVNQVENTFERMIRQHPEAAALVCDRCIVTKTAVDFETSTRYDFQLLLEEVSVKDATELIDSSDSTRKVVKKRISKGTRRESRRTEPIVQKKLTKYKRIRDPVKLMVDCSRVELLKHPLVAMFLRYKHAHLILPYWINLIVYLLFLAMFTTFMLQTKPRYLVNLSKPELEQADWNEVCTYLEENDIRAYVHVIWVSKFGTIGLAVINLLKELFQFLRVLRGPIGSKKIFILSTYGKVLQMVVYALAILVPIDFNSCMWTTGLRMDWQWWMGAVVLLTAWWNVVFFAQESSDSGIYVGIYQEILKNFFKLIVLFIPVLIGFALAFHQLLANQMNFKYVGFSFARVIIGDVDFGGTIFGHFEEGAGVETTVFQMPVTITLFVVYTLLITTAMSNMWIGFAVGDVSAMQDKAVIEGLRMKVNMLSDMEMLLHSFGIKWTPPSNYIFDPENKKKVFDYFIHRQVESQKTDDSKETGNDLTDWKKKLTEEMEGINEDLTTSNAVLSDVFEQLTKWKRGQTEE